MVRSILKIFADSLKICGKNTKQEKSVITDAENMGKVTNGRITTRCFLVLSFWIGMTILILIGLVYGGPVVWNVIGRMVSPS